MASPLPRFVLVIILSIAPTYGFTSGNAVINATADQCALDGDVFGCGPGCGIDTLADDVERVTIHVVETPAGIINATCRFQYLLDINQPFPSFDYPLRDNNRGDCEPHCCSIVTETGTSRGEWHAVLAAKNNPEPRPGPLTLKCQFKPE